MKMRFIEAGKYNQKVMLLIHGMQVPWQVWNEHIKYFSKFYHVIVPILSGHDPEDTSTFLSIQEEAVKIEDFLILHNKTEIMAICGVSMGGAISTLLWKRGNLQIENLILDGAPLLPYNKIISNIIAKQYLYLSAKVKKRDTKTLAKCEAKFMPSKYMRYFLDMIDIMSEETIQNCVISVSKYRLDIDRNIKNVNLAYFYGTGINEYYSKKSAKYLLSEYPQAKIHCLKGCSHCEFYLYKPEKHISMIEKSIDNL